MSSLVNLGGTQPASFGPLLMLSLEPAELRPFRAIALLTIAPHFA
jgi:hypothetical protein